MKEFNGFDAGLETCSIDDVDAALDATDATFLQAEILTLRKIRVEIDPLVWQSSALLFAPVSPSITQPIDDAARGSLDSASTAYVAARGCLADRSPADQSKAEHWARLRHGDSYDMWNSWDDDTYSIPPDEFGHYIDSFLDGTLAMPTVFRMQEQWNFHADCRWAPTGTTASTEMESTES